MALEVAHVAAWDWDLSSGQMHWSTDPEALFGFPKGAFGPEQRILSAVHAEDRADAERAWHSALQTGSYEAEYRAVRQDASIAWITERGRTVSSSDGSRMVGVSRDVTADRERARERETLLNDARGARDEAERQSRLKDEFLATLSHELRTPMNVILGWLSILEAGKPIREIHAALAVIAKNAQIQAKLINDLLDMSRLVSGRFLLDISVLDIGSLLQITIQSLQPSAEARGVQLIASVESDVTNVLADSGRLQQVMWNLVHNAIKFSGPKGLVEIRIQRAPSGLELIVKDNGRGISPSFLPYVFDRFRQQDPSGGREASFGLGLGLSIARHIVELHGGTVSAFSAGEGQGATFTVRLPEAPPAESISCEVEAPSVRDTG